MRGPTLAALLLLSSQAVPGAYITDRLLAGFYASPQSDAQPQRVLSDGTPLEILEITDRFTKVRLGDNSEGWVESRYITQEKPAKIRLLELQARYALLNKRPTQDRGETTKSTKGERQGAGIEQAPEGSLVLTPQQHGALRETLAAARSALFSDPGPARLQTGGGELKKQLTESILLLSGNSNNTYSRSDHSLSISWKLAWGVGLIVSFIAGIIYKNYRLSLRSDN